jgi:hypothetical protein
MQRRYRSLSSDRHGSFYQDYDDGGFVWDMAAHGFCPGLGIGF